MSIVSVSASVHLEDDTPVKAWGQDNGTQVLQFGHVLPRVDIYVTTSQQARHLEEAIAKIVAHFGRIQEIDGGRALDYANDPPGSI